MDQELISYLDKRFDAIETDIRELKADVKELKTDVKGLKTDVTELKADVEDLKKDTHETRILLEALRGDVQMIADPIAAVRERFGLKAPKEA
jgi:chromosome segregation ATPase